MTSRERLVAASRGGPVDRLPWFCWGAPDPISFAKSFAPDAVIVDHPEQATAALSEFDDNGPAVLVSVLNPLGLALQEGANPNEQTESDPQAASQVVEAYAQRVQARIEAALDVGADGVFYRIIGACPSYSTPMQYGGFHLETDRALLDAIREAPFNVALAEGKDVYLEFLTDLPAHALAWEPQATTMSGAEVQRMREGAVAYGLWSGWEQLVQSQSPGTILAGPFDADFNYRSVIESLMQNSTEVVQ